MLFNHFFKKSFFFYFPIILSITSISFISGNTKKNNKNINHHNQSTIMDASNPAVKKFINELVKEKNFDRQWLEKIFRQVVYLPQVISSIERPAEKTMQWKDYRKIFIKPSNIAAGVQFWRHNKDALIKAEKLYGVPAKIIVGIIGVESKFGKITGKYRAMDSLSTLAFAYPPRSSFFRSELKKLLILSHKGHMNPLSLTGSYAGALGIVQFMPSSYLNFAQSFDKNKPADIWHSKEDAISSVANYFKLHGWVRGEKILVNATITKPTYQSILSKSPKPTITLKQAISKGMKNAQPLSETTKVRPLQLEGANGPEYWLTAENFFVITTYNHSDLFAMAVYDLGTEIEKAYYKAESNFR